MKKITFLSIFAFISCQTTSNFEEIELTQPTMVSIAPDSLAMDQLIAKWGQEDFYTIIDDVMWYHSELMILVDSSDINQINAEKRRVKLIGPKESWKIDMDTSDVKWRYIYFDGATFIEKDAITMKDLLSGN